MEYNTMREFADSWGLFGMTLFFLFAVLYAFRPGSKEMADSARDIPFKDDAND